MRCERGNEANGKLLFLISRLHIESLGNISLSLDESASYGGIYRDMANEDALGHREL